MRKVGLLLLLTALLAVPAMGQDEYPKAEIFGGFSYMNFDSGVGDPRYNAVGWQASVAGNFRKNVGIVGDFGGQYKSLEGTRLWVYEYLFGPRFYYRTEKSTVFAHTLFGAATAGGGGGDTSTAFAMGYGGGVDVKISDRLAFRVMQVDYLPTHIGGIWEHNFRLGVGIVFTSGKK
jgi:hypothetical protein